jgi:hypothetical protein
MKHTSNAKISNRVIRHKVNQLIKLLLLRHTLVRIQLVEPVQPGQLEELLREEESGDEGWLRAEERQVLIMNIFHIGSREHAIVLAGEVDQKACRCQLFHASVPIRIQKGL